MARSAADTEHDHYLAHVLNIERALVEKTQRWDSDGDIAKFLCLNLHACVERKEYSAIKRSELGTKKYDSLYDKPKATAGSWTSAILSMEAMLMQPPVAELSRPPTLARPEGSDQFSSIVLLSPAELSAHVKQFKAVIRSIMAQAPLEEISNTRNRYGEDLTALVVAEMQLGPTVLTQITASLAANKGGRDTYKAKVRFPPH